LFIYLKNGNEALELEERRGE